MLGFQGGEDLTKRRQDISNQVFNEVINGGSPNRIKGISNSVAESNRAGAYLSVNYDESGIRASS